ncbi:hypothetical protein SAMN04488003_11220 [Loktanella fryxellensis]|uniref:DUF2059 domain-containing protein n=1 Tax=Loktanella fryxellensis TaxID=245187 RepID=A0A1H8F1U9_9RHOB|nr:DUF2059 domain-containing protein [Loktanella fryxellensis]SEN25723.1 hypothetical protein SAMN04488003_11220 [Loktanella fryxellensis]
MPHARTPFLIAALFGMALAGPSLAQSQTPGQMPTPVPETAQPDGDAQAALFAALGLPEMLEIMRDEGIAYGDEIAADLLGGSGGADWDATVTGIYDVDRMRGGVAAALTASLDGADVDAMLAFFTSDLGVEIVGLETSARRALLDEVVDQAAKDAGALARAEQTARADLVGDYIATNDLIETNVVGAMNANYAFYMGLQDGGAFGNDLTEDQILSDVYAQEPEIRATTTDWVYGFLMLAYQPLSDEDLQSYIAFSDSAAGRALNAAMFDAFDQMFVTISRELGRASAMAMAGQDI